MCKFKRLKKPNHWRIMLFLELQKTILNFQEKGQNDILDKFPLKDRYTVEDLSKALNLHREPIRVYLKELEELGFIHTCRFKGIIEVIL